ncbi:MAG TPA: hypothetical protein PKO06_19395 [Candidatus Ozemobacteraceae bacterium]|nr:hypothetical protein [Candidatus Ozemobacteraceae bacterium]
MSTQLQVRDVLNRFVEVHQQRREVFRLLRTKVRTERFRVLLDGLIRQQERILQGLQAQIDGMSTDLLNTWFKQPLSPPAEEWNLEQIPFTDDEFETVFVPNLIQRYNENAMAFLSEARTRAQIPELTELFASLMQVTEQELLKQWEMTQAVREL